jgi:hypothetical protein
MSHVADGNGMNWEGMIDGTLMVWSDGYGNSLLLDALYCDSRIGLNPARLLRFFREEHSLHDSADALRRDVFDACMY